jgi:ATP-dependent RNA helicase DDX6/DHH1
MDDNQIQQETIAAPAGLDTKGVRAPKKDNRHKTEDVQGTKGLTFQDFGLSQDVQLGLYELGFEKPSPIQEDCIPMAL